MKLSNDMFDRDGSRSRSGYQLVVVHVPLKGPTT